jgi:hypothetical protein
VDKLSRPPLECHPACIRDAIALAVNRITISPDGLAPRSGKPCPDQARDCVAINPVDEYKRFLGGAVRAVGEQF